MTAVTFPPDLARRRIDELEPYAGNAKDHPADQVEKLAASIARLGFNAPVLIAGSTILAGHARIEAAKLLGLEEVPVVVLDHLGADEQRAYVLADNRLGELATWNTDQLLTELAEIASSDAPELADLTGFAPADLDDLAGTLEDLTAELEPGRSKTKRKKRRGQDAEMPENVPPPIAKTGDVWQLGRHRVVVGDCRDAKVVAQVLGSEGFDVLIADPPYCSGSFQEAQKAAGTWGDIASDNLSARGYRALILAALAAAKPQAVYLFTDWRMWVQLFDVVESSGLAARSMIVWDKGSPGMGTFWRPQHELILYAARQPKKVPGEGSRGNVVHHPRTGNRNHYTEKPVPLIAELLECDATAGRTGPVFDPFMGAGTTLLAAEQLGRTCYGLDVEGRWVDVTVERWQELTGEAAKCSTGRRRKSPKAKPARKRSKAAKRKGPKE